MRVPRSVVPAIARLGARCRLALADRKTAVRFSNMTRREIGEGIGRAPARLKLSQPELAEQLDIPRSALSLIESGKRDVSALEHYRISRILGVSMERLLGAESAEGEERLMLRAG